MKPFGCRRFGRLLSEMADREATPREKAFLDLHRDACAACRREEEASCMSLDLLRGSVLVAEVEPGFDRRVLRRARVAMVRDGVRYWSPAMVGGLVAAGLLLAAVQAITKPIAPGSTPGLASKGVKDPSLALGNPRFNFNDANLNRPHAAQP